MGEELKRYIITHNGPELDPCGNFTLYCDTDALRRERDEARAEVERLREEVGLLREKEGAIHRGDVDAAKRAVRKLDAIRQRKEGE